MHYTESMSSPINPDHVRIIHQKQKPQKMSPLLVIAKRVVREAISGTLVDNHDFDIC